VSHIGLFNISGQNINFVCGLVDKSLEVQINARRIKFVKCAEYFLPSPPKCEEKNFFGGGLTVFVNSNI